MKKLIAIILLACAGSYGGTPYTPQVGDVIHCDPFIDADYKILIDGNLTPQGPGGGPNWCRFNATRTQINCFWNKVGLVTIIMSVTEVNGTKTLPGWVQEGKGGSHSMSCWL